MPTLIYYSDVDQVGLAEPIEKVIAGYKKNNIPVFSQKFIGSPHVSHFHHYPVEYTEQLNNFLEYIKLSQSHESENEERLKVSVRV